MPQQRLFPYPVAMKHFITFYYKDFSLSFPGCLAANKAEASIFSLELQGLASIVSLLRRVKSFFWVIVMLN